MAYYATVDKIEFNGSFVTSYSSYIDSTINSTVETAVQNSWHINLDLGFDLSLENIQAHIQTAVLAYAVAQGYTPLTASAITWGGPNLISPNVLAALKVATQAKSFNYTPGRSIVTGTGATGFQVSSTRDSVVTYSTKIVTTATIAGGQEGYVVLEIAPTNSATAGDWKEVGRVTNGQALSLALTLQSIQPVSGILMGIVPAGYYVKVRSVNITGTPSYNMVSGQEILI